MRRMLSMIPAVIAVVACAKTEQPAADTAAVAVAPAATPTLTEADVAGTWKGTSSPVGSDSVTGRWTQVCRAGTCQGTQEGSKATVVSTYTMAGDSSVGVSKPFSDPTMAKGAQLIDTWVAHINGENVTGTGAMKLASNQDSVVFRYQFTGSRVSR